MTAAAALARALLVAAALAVALCVPAAAAEWQPDPVFRIDPTQVPGYSDESVRANYRLLNPQGNPTGPLVSVPAKDLLDWIEVPADPGVYKLEAWTEDASGAEVRRATTLLRFDDVAPPPPTVEGPGRWLLGGEIAQLEISQPEGTLPLSDIRGYALSLDAGTGTFPCQTPALCTPAEPDVLGAGDTSVSLGTLPQGTNYARVVAVSGAGVPSSVRSVIVRVDATPPRLTLSGVPGGWSSGPVRLDVLAADQLSGMAAAGPAGPFTAIAVDASAPTRAPGDGVSGWVAGSGVHEVVFYARDAAGNLADGTAGSAAPGTAVVRIDEDPPRVEFAAAQDPAEPERIEALVSDPLSGVSGDRGSIALRPTGTQAAFEALPTRVAGERLVAHWDSDSYPPGKYEFRATGFDLAGNPEIGTDRAHGGRMVLVNPLKAPTSLDAELSGGRFHGVLRRLGGGPLADQEVTVIEAFATGAVPRRREIVLRTGPRGGFSLPLGKGPSRYLLASFAGTRTLTGASSSSARREVRTGVQLRASRPVAKVGGPPVVFRGRVLAAGAARAAGGLPVELQFRYRGAGWSEFRTVETDRRGRFHYAYRFSDDDSRGVRFQFRAYVKDREGWPYEPGSSRPVTVTGR
ncbi:MAG TPA: hypothetical protein VKB23_00190 [Solirubrobacterales bacterium]|nr:hypothetical protein [Solirubrobacterales bacterium]